MGGRAIIFCFLVCREHPIGARSPYPDTSRRLPMFDSNYSALTQLSAPVPQISSFGRQLLTKVPFSKLLAGSNLNVLTQLLRQIDRGR